MDLDDRSWAAVRNTPGVTGFVGSEGKPSPLTREEYNKIMKRTTHEAPKKTASSLEVGQAVKVISGPLAEFDGVVSEVNPEAGKLKSSFQFLVERQALSFLTIRSQRSRSKLPTMCIRACVWTGLLSDMLVIKK